MSMGGQLRIPPGLLQQMQSPQQPRLPMELLTQRNPRPQLTPMARPTMPQSVQPLAAANQPQPGFGGMLRTLVPQLFQQQQQQTEEGGGLNPPGLIFNRPDVQPFSVAPPQYPPGLFGRLGRM